MSNRNLILWGTMAASLVFIIPQVFILLALGLSPTVVAFIVDKSKSKYAAFSVGGMNVAGVTPSLLELWNGKNNVSAAMDILTDPFDLAIMFAGAGFGWMLYLVIPPVVSGLLTVIAHHRITQLRTEQKKLIKEWGEGIAVGPRAIDAREAAQDQDNIVDEKIAASNGEPDEEPLDQLDNVNGVPEPQTPSNT